MKNLYGKTVIDNSDSDELEDDFKIELEYYQLEDETSGKPYGIEIVKRYVEGNYENIENKRLKNICSNKQKNDRILEILTNNKVTPISVEDILQDLKWQKYN